MKSVIERAVFIGITNRDTGKQEWLAVHRIYRVMPCPNEDHAGYALIWMDVPPDKDGNYCVIEADLKVEEFMERLSGVLEG